MSAPRHEGNGRSTVQLLSTPVREASAWRASDLAADSSWIYELTDDDVSELNQAIAGIQFRGLGPISFGRADFPLPRLGNLISRLLHQLEFGRGCALIRGLPVGHYDAKMLSILYWGLGSHLGQPISQNAQGELIAHVRDTGRDYKQKNVRGYLTRAPLAPHSDSCDVVGLLCVSAARTGGSSIFASSMTIYNEILAHHPEYLEALYRGFHYDLRGEGATGDPNEVTRRRVPVFSYFDGRLSCRFNGRSIENGMTKAGVPLSALEQEAIDYIAELVWRSDIGFRMSFRAGDIQLLNNHVMLHAREGYEDHNDEGRKRDLMRLWLNLYAGRKLAPDFADRFNTGPRGGVPVHQD